MWVGTMGEFDLGRMCSKRRATPLPTTTLIPATPIFTPLPPTPPSSPAPVVVLCFLPIYRRVNGLPPMSNLQAGLPKP
ncbi:MAG UNVERIFIED_CONTAM: hypothetical protein LVT10_03730 [Anaerolineae bacterium]